MKDLDPSKVTKQLLGKPSLLTSVLALEASSFADVLQHERVLHSALLKEHSAEVAGALSSQPEQLTSLFAAHPEFLRKMSEGLERVQKTRS